MRNYNSIARILAGLLAVFSAVGLATGADFTGRAINVPIRYSEMESNVPDAGVLSFGDDQDVTFSYDTTNGELDVTGKVNVSGGVEFSGEQTIGDGTGAITFNSGTYNTSNSDDDITNVGDIAVDSISADSTALSIDSNWDAAGVTCSDLGTVTTADVNGGSIDGTVIGAASAVAITGSTITGSTITDGTASLASGTFSGIADLGAVTTADINAGTVDATIGGTTPAAGAFTTLEASSTVDLNGSIDADVTGCTIDATGAVTIQGTEIGGANVGVLIKQTFQAGETYTGGTSGGLIIKAYDADGTVVHEGGETVGAYINFKLSSAPTAGGESAVLSLHNYPGLVNPDFGVRLFGNYNDDLVQFAASSAVDGIDMRLSTITGSDLVLSNSETIDNVTDGVINAVGNVQIRGALQYAGTSASTGLNTYVLDATPDLVVTAPTLGQVITWTSDTAGDGASTISIDGISDTLQDRAGNATGAGDVIVGPMQAQFDGTNWRLIGI
jgi:hypothetical protein